MKFVLKSLFLAVLLSSCASGLPFTEEESFIQIDAPAGNIIGLEENDHYAFKGLPYAQAPIGDLRWKAPRDLPRFNEVFSATEFQSKCIQPSSQGLILNRSISTGSEDCLFMNIYVPKNQNDINTNKFPVMFWIHGGSNIWGSGDFYDFSKLAASQQVIVITLNYRLGLFGWFASEHIRETSEGLDQSPNFGQLDLIKGLEWVNTNISAFGGDKNNVTIFGESAGGHNVFALLSSPMAKGLFQKAISQSGYVSSYSRDFAENISELSSKAIFKEDIKFMVDSEEIVSFMKDLSAEEIYQRYKKTADDHIYAITPITIRDDIVIPEKGLYESLERIDESLVVVAGTNKDEMNYWYINSDYFYNTSAYVIKTLNRSEDNLKSWIEYRSDIWRYKGAEEPLRRMAKSNSNLYSYRFDWDEQANSNIAGNYQVFVGAAHGLEIPFLTGDFDLGPITFYVKPFLFPDESEEGRLALSERMMSYWANVAKYGNPNEFISGTKWEKFTADNNQILILDNPLEKPLEMKTMPVVPNKLLDKIEADSALEIMERCLIGWIAVRDFKEDKRPNPPFRFCDKFSQEDLYNLRNLSEGRD